MTDEIEVTRDPGTSDDVWNESEGRYESDLSNGLVYRGPAIVSSRGWTPQEVLEGGQEYTMAMYKSSIPIDGPEVMEDDVVKVIVCDRDPRLINKEFLVRDLLLTTWAVAQSFVMERHTGRRPR